MSLSCFGSSHSIADVFNCDICRGDLWSVIFDVPIEIAEEPHELLI